MYQHYYEEESAAWAWARRWLMELALMILTSNAWIPFYLLWRRELEEVLVLARPFLAALALWGAVNAFDHARLSGLLGVCTGRR